QIVAADETALNTSKPVPELGPTQLLCQIEATGICFSDTKLLHAFSSHPRKSEVLTFLSAEELAEIPSYVPGDLPTVPGHEACARVVAVGSEVKRHKIGDRALVQTDYRHMLTAASNASFGYNFEGALQQYVLMDERVIIDPDTGERFLIPVSEEPSASAVGLLEPWACVERAYATEERGALKAGGALLVVADAGHAVEGLAELVNTSAPGSITAIAADDGQKAALEALGATFVENTDSLEAGSYDDVIYFGADPARVEGSQALVGLKGVFDIVLGGELLGRPVEVDVGRIHYDLTRWVGTLGTSAADGYAWVPATGELREGEKVGIIGAAGPMGFMHVIRALTAGLDGVAVTAIDIDEARLAHLTSVAAPLAESKGLAFESLDSKDSQPQPGFTRIGVMVPSPALTAGAVELAGEGAIMDIFAGFAIGTTAPLDIDQVLRKQVYMLGTSGSMISDMKAVLGRLESGALDTNISVYAVSGMQGVADALEAVRARTSGGKIVIYPQLTGMGMITLSDMAEVYPTVAAAFDEGRWTRAAEEALLAAAGGDAVA
ncbi:MAG: alcohol dehydrogenase catalytic domain-containing protein, partial [Chloroflexota bacterium]|nr:alcohol dehydrogenase catalytic domain-containing protein [Chloroflexota bacterium]